MQNFQPIYRMTGDAAPKGLYSALDGQALDVGMFKEAQNVRYLDDGILKDAPGTTLVLENTGLPAGTVIGLTKEPIPWGGKSVILCAIYPDSAPTTVEIWASWSESSSLTQRWAQCTKSSGQFGDTRGSIPAYGSVTFEPISDSSGVLGCVVQYGNRSEDAFLVNFSEFFRDNGTTTSTTANKLVDSSQNFTSTVAVDDVVINDTDGTTATVSAVDSGTTLSLSSDIMVSSERYTIVRPACFPIKNITAPKWAGGSAAEATMSAWMSVAAGTMKTSWSTNGIANVHYNTGGTFDVAGDGELNLSTAAGYGREWRLVSGTGGTYGPAVNDFGWFQLNSAVDFSGGKQVVMLYSSASSEIYFQNCQIALTQQVETGTTTATTANKLTDSGQNFTSTVRVGDFVINTTDNTYTTVTAVDSNTVLSLAADVVPTAKVYYIVRKYVIHDPAATIPVNEKRDIIVESVSSVKMAVFPVPQEASLASVDGIMFTVTDTTNWTATATFRIQWLASGGTTPGEAQYAVGYYSTFTYTDSPAVILRSAQASQNASTLIGVNTNRDPEPEYFISVRAGVAGGAVPPEFYMPIHPEVYYKYRVPIWAPISETVNGVTAPSGWSNKMSIYRKDVNESAFSHIADVDIAAYSGGNWVIDTSDATYGTTFLDKAGNAATSLATYQKIKAYISDTTEIGDKDFLRKAPDAFVEAMPPGQAMMFSGKRFHVGAFNAASDSNANQMNEIRVSEVNRPFRFRTLMREINREEDVDSGFAIPLGNESIRSFFDVSASVIGTPATYCATDKSLIRYIGYEPRRIASAGCIAPGTVTEKDGVTMWLDHENLVRQMDGVLREIATLAVTDSLNACPAARRQFAQSLSHRNKWYISLADASSNNNYRVGVYDTLHKTWESFDKYPETKAPQYWLQWNVDGHSKVYYMATDRRIYEFGSGADHAGTDIAIAVTFPDIVHPKGEKSIRVEEVGVVSTASTAGMTLTFTRTDNNETSSTSAGTMSLTHATKERVKMVDRVNGTIPGIESDSVKLRMTATKTSATGSMGIRKIDVDVKEAGYADYNV